MQCYYAHVENPPNVHFQLELVLLKKRLCQADEEHHTQVNCIQFEVNGELLDLS